MVTMSFELLREFELAGHIMPDRRVSHFIVFSYISCLL